MIKGFHYFYIILFLICCVGCIEPDDKIVTLSTPKAEVKKDINITLILPLTGPNANTGKNLLDAALMALGDFKKSNVHITTIDSTHTAEKIIAKLEKFKTDLIIGPVYASDVQKLIHYTKEKDLCMITFSNDTSISSNGCTLLLGVMPEQSITKVIKFTKNKGYSSILAVLPKSKYGEAIAKHLREQEVEIAGFYDTHHNSTKKIDIEKAINTIKSRTSTNAKVAVLIPDNKEAAHIASMLAAKNAKPFKFIGGGLWEDETIYTHPSLNEGWFAAPPKQLRPQFENHFTRKYGYKPQKIATLGYDAICLAAILLDNNTYDKITLSLFTKDEGFTGLTSNFKFLPTGINIRELSIYEIKDRKISEIEPANDSFKTE